jgi:sugar lactone lactonase YvrE
VALGATLALASAPALGQDETTITGFPTGFKPTQLAVGPDGSLYASDCAAARVYRIGPDGVSVVIGSGPGGCGAGFKGDGGPATEAETLCPYGIAFDPEGRLVLVDHGNNRVRRVDEMGVITTVAGSGPGQFQGGFEGDEGPATEGLMQEPTGVAIADDGVVFVADRDNDRVRRIGTDGVITTVAGGGDSTAADLGDGGPAMEASLDTPVGLAVDSEGNLYIADSGNWRIRRVTPDGVIETIAGTGEAASTGDGGPATEAAIGASGSLLLDATGNLYVGDPDGNRIRVITPDGTITTFAGTGASGETGDGGPASAATLRLRGDPASLAIDVSGNIYIGDSGNHVIRVVDPSGMISTLAPGPGRSARPRRCHGAHRCSGSSLRRAVELRREESRGRLQDLVGPPQLAVLPLQLADAPGLLAGGAGSRPRSISAWTTQRRSDSGPMPSSLAMRVTVPKRSSPRSYASRTMRMARCFSSGGYLRGLARPVLPVSISAMTPWSSNCWSLHRSQDGSLRLG